MFLRFNAKVGEKSEFRGKFVPGSELAIPFGTNCERGFGRIASKHRVFKGKLWNLWHTGDNTRIELKLLISFSCKDIWFVTVFFFYISFSFLLLFRGIFVPPFGKEGSFETGTLGIRGTGEFNMRSSRRTQSTFDRLQRG